MTKVGMRLVTIDEDYGEEEQYWDFISRQPMFVAISIAERRSEVDNSQSLERLARSLYFIRQQKKALEKREKSVKGQIEELWGPIIAKSESRIAGTVRITASERELTEYDFETFKGHLATLSLLNLLPQVTEQKIDKKAVTALIKAKALPGSITELLQVTSSYLVWTVDEAEKEK